MATRTAVQFNSGFTPLPCVFLGKERDDKIGAASFRPAGKKRLAGNQLLILGAIHKIKDKFDDLVKIMYSTLTNATGRSRTTVWRALNALGDDKIIERTGVSDYKIATEEFKAKPYIFIYDFLLQSAVQFRNGKKAVKLSSNAVILLCNIISFYQNPENKGKYYVGGRERDAAFLNVSPSTAAYALKELISCGAIYKHTRVKDSGGNYYFPKDATGRPKLKYGKDSVIVYVLNDELKLTCNRLKREYEKKLQAAAEVDRQVVKEAAETVELEDGTTVEYTKTAPRKKHKKKKRDTVDDWASFAAKIASIEEGRIVTAEEIRAEMLGGSYIEEPYIEQIEAPPDSYKGDDNDTDDSE